tara:strand:+ start:43 stop:804 length:762 start_codon:yes stop_codon:yes gene_type:complete
MVSKEEYLNYMQGSGYLDSPIFQQGFERWDPESKESAWMELLYNTPLRGDNVGMAGRSTGMYVPGPSEGQQERGYYDQFHDAMGHETSHLGWDYDNAFRKGIAEIGGGWNTRGEENWNYMHDMIYGNPDFLSTQRNYLMNKGFYNPSPTVPPSMGFKGPADWTEKGYSAISGSGLVDWQQDLLRTGLTDRVTTQDRGQAAPPVSQPSGRPPGQPSTGPHIGYGASATPPPQRDYTRHEAYGLRRGGIASLWHR